MDPEHNKGVTIVQQQFNMDAFIKRQIDSASAMTYNELAQVLETKNSKTGKLYQMSDLNVIKMQNVGTGMLEDGIFSTGKWLKDSANQAIAVKFLAASLKGWAYCRDHAAECVGFTLKAGPTLPKGHQTWMMNEINKLTWPSAAGGIGVMDKAAYAQTAKISKQFGVIKKAPVGAYRTDLAVKAVASLKKAGIDVNGKSWKAANIKLTAGGK
jgi:NitT/TauT family transport system substrate-binding protein